MAKSTDVFYGFCTFWTGDWDWLAERNGAGKRPAPVYPEPVTEALKARGITIQPREPRAITSRGIPHCPFCGSMGFEMSRKAWMQQAQEWEAGTSEKAIEVRR